MDNILKPEGFEEEKLFVLPPHMAAELSRFPLTRDLYVSDIGFFPRARHHYRERKEGCESHIFIYCSDGEGWVESEGTLSILRERQLAVIPAGVPHRYGASTAAPWSIYWFHLQGEQVLDYIRLYNLDSGPLSLPAGAYGEMVEGFDKCYGLLSDKPYSLPVQVLVSRTIGQMLGTIGLRAGGSAIDRKREQDLERAIRYMNERLTSAIKLSDVATYAGLSKQHLIYLFNQETGMPPIEYFLRLKMQKAGQLLSLTGMTVKEIAAYVGNPDPYYFSRLFKKIMGMSPTEYRNVPKG
ncbi:helix-turn-helix domain-containing protein [Cohnella luojiensis]|uniref:AraC family transcriptional regulator n=1 Tax=Cohnella luojiensis TaxID=652876 RepID=A0A4Y8M299_9BACL|nr:AraC family transcriptional regulator [Cohnella luojiensis]TFE28609.1 AraC family transcriptional regulator [Cohnella luojiensis]